MQLQHGTAAASKRGQCGTGSLKKSVSRLGSDKASWNKVVRNTAGRNTVSRKKVGRNRLGRTGPMGSVASANQTISSEKLE